MCTPESTATRAKTSRVHAICAQYCRDDCYPTDGPTGCLVHTPPLSPQNIQSHEKSPAGCGACCGTAHRRMLATNCCCSYCYNAQSSDRLAQIIVNQAETRKRGGIHTRVLDGGGQAVEMGCRQAAPFPPLAVSSPAVSLRALLSRSAMLAGPLLSQAGGARSMPPNPAPKVPPGPHSRDVNSRPREREGGYYGNYSGCPLLRDSGLPPRGGGVGM